MAATRGAVDLDPMHPVAEIVDQLDVGPVRRLGEARPPRARVELRLGGEQLGAAAGTAIRSVRLLVEIGAGERALGSMAPKHLVLSGRQLLAPLALGLLDPPT